MRIFPLLLAAFLLVPLVEIYVLLKVGGAIGAGWTIFLVVFTAVLGAFLVRAQGFSTYLRVQQSIQRQQMPAMELLEGLVLLVAGALLLTPGFVTDALGFACLTPPLRRRVIGHALRHWVSGDLPGATPARSSSHDKRTMDGEFRRLDD
ncbi:MAG: FxsA family protein [Gammaproteobacteria bacterium]|nr:FxsA family protein [Gammaproteobacteria bacterium]